MTNDKLQMTDFGTYARRFSSVLQFVICHVSFVIRNEPQASSGTFHACNVRARVMKTEIVQSGARFTP